MTRSVVAINVVLLLVVVGSGFLASQAVMGRVAVERPLSIDAPLCPAASTERAR